MFLHFAIIFMPVKHISALILDVLNLFIIPINLNEDS